MDVYNSLQASHATLQQQMADAQAQLPQLKQQLADAEAQVPQLQQQLAEAEAQVAQLKQQQQQHDKESKGAQFKYSKVAKQLQEAQVGAHALNWGYQGAHALALTGIIMLGRVSMFADCCWALS